ncbi:MAG: glucokinase [Chitinophagaceae bacterium]|nr:MAG: glucokinase [Chitinophagaceae bacterium]
MSIPVSLPGRSVLPLGGLFVLGGDVGGTKTNLALYHATREKLVSVKEKKFSSGDFSSVAGIIEAFLKEVDQIPDRICLGVAGPVLNGRAELTNLDWLVDSDQLLKQFQVEKVSLINDLEAIAYGLAEMEQEQLIQLCRGNPLTRGNMAIIAPGTGLGQAGLFWDGKYYHPFPTEGGHCDFSPRTQEDYDLCRYLQALYGVVSWEKLISGSGIVDTFNFLNQKRGNDTPTWLSDKLLTDDAPAAITDSAEENSDEVCVKTMQLFVRYLARETSNLVLKMKATGGVFIAGGIPPKIAGLIRGNDFYQHFMDCDRMQHLLEEVPVYIVKEEKAGLIGAAGYGAYASR